MGKDNKALRVLASNVFLLPPRSGDLWPRRRLECSRPSTKPLATLPNKTEPAAGLTGGRTADRHGDGSVLTSIRGMRGTTA